MTANIEGPADPKSRDMSADVYAKHYPKFQHVFLSDLAVDGSCLQNRVFASQGWFKRQREDMKPSQ